MPQNGQQINGRNYTKHALERMAPDTPQVRAISQGYERGSKEFNNFVSPRGIPPSVVEGVIEHSQAIQGKTPGTMEYHGPDLKIVTNLVGDVITVIPS